jgi:benzodiazapine receptor
LLTEIGPWYRGLRQSRIKPPDWAFGPVWTVILALWAAAGALAWESPGANHQQIAILFGVNFALHLLWSPLFFKWHRPDWAFFELTFLWFSILAMIIGVATVSTLAAWLLVPYIAWVAVAGWINLSVVRLNGPFGARAAPQ